MLLDTHIHTVRNWSEPIITFAPLSNKWDLPQGPVAKSHSYSGRYSSLAEEFIVWIFVPFGKGVSGADVAFEEGDQALDMMISYVFSGKEAVIEYRYAKRAMLEVKSKSMA